MTIRMNYIPQSESFSRIQQDRDWAFVDEFDLHHFLETSGFTAQTRGADALDE